MSTTTTTTSTILSKSPNEQIKRWISSLMTPNRKQSIITITIASLTLVGIGFLFSLFLAVSLLDDFVRIISPGRFVSFTRNRIDWTGFIDQISHQLTNFAEWERQKRASWATNEEYNHNTNDDRFHEMIAAVTNYMNDYVHHRKQQTTKEDY
ncbi:unnamed protein product [Mucor hiemalis]